VHFYSPVVDAEDSFAVSAVVNRIKHPVPAGIGLGLDSLKELIQRFTAHCKLWPFSAEENAVHRVHYGNPFFGPFDAAICPRRVIEIGCGWSSKLLLDTRDLFLHDKNMEITFIDPNMDQAIVARESAPGTGVNFLDAGCRTLTVEYLSHSKKRHPVR